MVLKKKQTTPKNEPQNYFFTIKTTLYTPFLRV